VMTYSKVNDAKKSGMNIRVGCHDHLNVHINDATLRDETKPIHLLTSMRDAATKSPWSHEVRNRRNLPIYISAI